MWEAGMKRLEGPPPEPPDLARMARDGILDRRHSLSKGTEAGNRGKCGLLREKHSNRRAEDTLGRQVGPDHGG